MAFLRQQGIISPEKFKDVSVAIIGTGSIGSFTALTLVKMGIKDLTLYDHDIVQLQNISNQFFPINSLGMPKVKSVEAECLRHAPEELPLISAIDEFYSGQELPNQIVIALTDNIEGRAAAFKAAKESFMTEFFIDGRMNADLVRILALNPKNKELAEKYEKDFLEDVENSEEPCTARTIVYNVLLASSLITAEVKKYLNNEPVPFQFCFTFSDFSQVKSRSF